MRLFVLLFENWVAKNMYDKPDESSGTIQSPQSYVLIEEMHKELSRLEDKLAPIMRGPSLEKPPDTPTDGTELIFRLEALARHTKEITNRVKF